MFKIAMIEFFTLKGPKFWGDCGSILTSGMATRTESPRVGDLVLKRTGPFVPPITFPKLAVVVTEDFRCELDESGFGQFHYREVIKDHIVELNWEHFDRNGRIPDELLTEVEGHILFRPHSEIIAMEVGTLWEIVLPEGGATTSFRERGSRIRRVVLDRGSWTGLDFFRSSTQGYTLVTSRFAKWLSAYAGDWITLSRIDG